MNGSVSICLYVYGMNETVDHLGSVTVDPLSRAATAKRTVYGFSAVELLVDFAGKNSEIKYVPPETLDLHVYVVAQLAWREIYIRS